MAEKASKTIAVGILTTMFTGLGAFFFNQLNDLTARVNKNETKIENQKEILLRIDQRVYEIHGKLDAKN